MTHTNPRIAALMAAERPWLADGGLETTLVFHEGLELPEFASFPLLESGAGMTTIDAYYARYVHLAQKAGTGFIMDTPTWRANTAWGPKIGYDAAALEDANRRAVAHMRALRDIWETPTTPIIVEGVIGPLGDGYVTGEMLSAAEAEARHRPQIAALASAGADMVSGFTLTYAEEAVGIVRAAADTGVPVVISFTLETDGALPSGQPLDEAIAQVDAETGGAALYFMINCAHPDHYAGTVSAPGDWRYRIGGLRSNASRMSHAELDAAEELDDGNPEEFGRLHRDLTANLPALRVLGGCCGTDERHVGCVCGEVLWKDVAA